MTCIDEMRHVLYTHYFNEDDSSLVVLSDFFLTFAYFNCICTQHMLC